MPDRVAKAVIVAADDHERISLVASCASGNPSIQREVQDT